MWTSIKMEGLAVEEGAGLDGSQVNLESVVKTFVINEREMCWIQPDGSIYGLCLCIFHTRDSSSEFPVLNDNFIMWVPPVVTTIPAAASWASYKRVIYSSDSSAGTCNTRFIAVTHIKIEQESKSHHNSKPHLCCKWNKFMNYLNIYT